MTLIIINYLSLIGLSIIVDFNPALRAALENKDFGFVFEKSIWDVRLEPIGKPDNKDSAEKGLWNNLVYKTKDSNKVSLVFKFLLLTSYLFIFIY